MWCCCKTEFLFSLRIRHSRENQRFPFSPTHRRTHAPSECHFILDTKYPDNLSAKGDPPLEIVPEALGPLLNTSVLNKERATNVPPEPLKQKTDNILFYLSLHYKKQIKKNQLQAKVF